MIAVLLALTLATGINQAQPDNQWKILATSSASFAGSPEGLMQNLAVGTSYFNKWFSDRNLEPGEEVSLNEIFGESTEDQGYVLGPSVALEDGYAYEIWDLGGGICFLPSVLFPATLRAGLEVVARQNHSYFPYLEWGYPEGLGLDAAVAPPWTPDFVVRNNYRYPVSFKAEISWLKLELTVTILGPAVLVPHQVEVVGPIVTTGNHFVETVVYQKVWVEGNKIERSYYSLYYPKPTGN